MLVDIIYVGAWYVRYRINNKQVDLAGPFDEEWEAEDVMRRA